MNQIVVSSVIKRSTRRPAFVWDTPRVMMEMLEPRRLLASSIDVFGSAEGFGNIVSLRDGGVLVMGEVFDALSPGEAQRQEKAALLRLDANLRPVETFGESGMVYRTDSYIFTSAIELSDGSFMVAGSPYENGGGVYDQVNIYNFNADGSLNTSFDGDGKLSITVPGEHIQYQCTVLERADGKIVVVTGDSAARGVDANNGDVYIYQFNRDGTPDRGFDGDGLLVINHHKSGMWNTEESRAALALPDGRIVVAITFDNRYDDQRRYDDYTHLVAINTDGTIDTGFGTGGYIELSRTSYMSHPTVHLVCAPDGSLVVSTTIHDANTGGTTAYDTARYTQDGELIRSFGQDGHLILATTAQVDGNKWWKFPEAIRVVGDELIVGYTGGYERDEEWRFANLNNNAIIEAQAERFSLESGDLLTSQKYEWVADGPAGPGFMSSFTLDHAGKMLAVSQLSDYLHTPSEIAEMRKYNYPRDLAQRRFMQARLIVTRLGEDSPITHYSLPPVYPNDQWTPTPFPPAQPLPEIPAENPSIDLPSGEEAFMPGGMGDEPDNPRPFASWSGLFFEDDDDLLERVNDDVLVG